MTFYIKKDQRFLLSFISLTIWQILIKLCQISLLGANFSQPYYPPPATQLGILSQWLQMNISYIWFKSKIDIIYDSCLQVFPNFRSPAEVLWLWLLVPGLFMTVLKLCSRSPITVLCSALSVSQSVFTITEKAPTRAFSWLKAPTSAFTFKTLLRHYAKQKLTPQ